MSFQCLGVKTAPGLKNKNYSFIASFGSTSTLWFLQVIRDCHANSMDFTYHFIQVPNLITCLLKVLAYAFAIWLELTLNLGTPFLRGLVHSSSRNVLRVARISSHSSFELRTSQTFFLKCQETVVYSSQTVDDKADNEAIADSILSIFSPVFLLRSHLLNRRGCWFLKPLESSLGWFFTL